MGDLRDDEDAYLESEGWNELHFAAMGNDVTTLKKAFEDKSAEFVTDKAFHTPLHVAALFGSLDALKLILDNISLEQASITNHELMNALHVAVELNQIACVQILLNNEIFKQKLKDPDLYGRTPFDIAVQNGHMELMTLLSEKPISDFTQVPGFASFVDLSQENLEENLEYYLESKGRDPEPFIDIFGECNGWEFLYQIYLSNNAEDEFFAILKIIANRFSLDYDTLPPLLAKKYNHVEDVFEQLINDLSICHTLTKGMREVNLNIFQPMRRKQYDLIKSKSDGREIRQIFSMDSLSYNPAQLTEQIALFATRPGTSIDIYTHDHAISLYVLPNGQFKLYDPGFKLRVPSISSPQVVSEALFKFVVPKNPEGQAYLAFNAYKFYPKGAPLPRMEHARVMKTQNSPNGFTPLHFAIFANDIETVKREANAESVLKRDAHGVTPLKTAVSFGNTVCISLIAQHVKAPAKELDFTALCALDANVVINLMNQGSLKIGDTDENDLDLLASAIIAHNQELVSYLLKQDKFDLNKLDKHGFSYLHYAIGMLPLKEMPEYVLEEIKSEPEELKQASFVDIDSIVLKALLEQPKLEVNSFSFDENFLMIAIRNKMIPANFALLLAHKDIQVNAQNTNGFTALMYAVLFFPDLIEPLIKAGAQTHLKTTEGKTAYDLAKEIGLEETLLKRLKPKEQAPKQVPGRKALLTQKPPLKQINQAISAHKKKPSREKPKKK